MIVTVVVIAVIALVAGVTGAFSGGSSSNKAAAPRAPACPKADGSSRPTTSFPAAPPMCIDTSKTYTATMQTSQGGPITIALDAKQAPKTVNNFVFLSRYHFYDGLTFHRVVPSFVLQGGDPQGTGSGGPGYQFADELPKAGSYKVGSLAMANSGPNTNGSQFFIIVGDQGTSLPPNYSLFGQVTDGIDVAHAIEKDGASDPNNGEPKEKITMTSVTIQQS